MKRASIWSLMVILQIGSSNQVHAMSKEIPPTSLTATPELAIGLLTDQVTELLPLQQKIASCASYDEKISLVQSLPHVKEFFGKNPQLEEAIMSLPVHLRYVVTLVVALNQGQVLFANWQDVPERRCSLEQLANTLYETERFYDYMGGLAGYHVKTLELMSNQLAKKAEPDHAKLLLPPSTDIRQDSLARKKMVKDSIASLGQMAEMYVVGGAGDRLALVDEKTQMPLPVARLGFAGHTLLENLVRDLQAREYLAYKLTGSQVVTPIVLMTSHEKNNDAQIAAILDERAYFGRPKESIFRLLQPMTPVLAIDGKWAVRGPLEPILKPGGHGVIWKLADEYGAFDWLVKQKRRYLVVRQINNPLAGLDANLLALAGFGHANKKAFGFESVPRLPNMSEGMNVLKETANDQGVCCTISNIEYTEFAKAKISDPQFALIADSPDFPANTNILFANIDSVRKATKVLPVPGYLVNMKQPVETLRDGKKVELLASRLESTMQNIADAITTQYASPVSAKDLASLDTFVLINNREKTISVTKKAYDGKSIQETPEGCFYDAVKENLRLLKSECLFEVPELNSPSEYMQRGPNAIFLYHPALGPLYSVIGQKISKGRLASGAELQIEASEVSISNLSVEGSFLIEAQQIMGRVNDTTGSLEYSPLVGRCVLKNVQVKNKGIDRAAKNSYFTSAVQRLERLKVQLLGCSELIAKDVVLEGNLDIIVQPGTRVILSQGTDGKLKTEVQDLGVAHPDSVVWHYSFDADDSIKLRL